MSTEQVWIAIDLYPESAEVLVSATEDGLLKQIVNEIGRSEYEAFKATLRGDQATDVTFDDEPLDVLRIWSGDPEPWGESEADGYRLGEDWRVLKAAVDPTPTQTPSATPAGDTTGAGA